MVVFQIIVSVLFINRKDYAEHFFSFAYMFAIRGISIGEATMFIQKDKL